MKVKIKRLTADAVIPNYSKDGDAGLDLVATSKKLDEKGNAVYGTSLALEIPKGFVGMLFPRSSISKNNQFLTNSVGIIDSGYRGEIMLKMKPTMKYPVEGVSTDIYEIGDRIGQLIIMPYPSIDFEEVSELSETERGSGGYGSSGK